MTTKTKHTAETITCYPVNMDKLNQEVNQLFHKDNPNPAIDYRVHSRHALVKVPKSAIIDEEFIGSDVSAEVTWYVYETENRADGSKVGHCMPAHKITLTLTGLESYLLSPISLAEFAKDRRGYNARICANESAWMRHFNS